MNSLADNPLVRAVARIPTTVQRKFLVPVAIVVVLLVTVGQLPPRVALYTELQDDGLQLSAQLQYRHQLITPCTVTDIDSQNECGLETGTCFVDFVPGCAQAHASPVTTLLLQADASVETILSTLVSSSSPADVGIVLSSPERSLLSEINSKSSQLSVDVAGLALEDKAGRYPDNKAESDGADTGVEAPADGLVSLAQSEAANLIAQNQASYLSSQHLFIGVAAGSVVLTLLLGVILSWALVEPIKKIRGRLGAIAEGDFSGYVDVPNRDELGALAADVNGMSDELGRLYGELDAASRHKSEFLANMSHELRTPLNAVIGFSEVLQDRLFGELNAKQAEYGTDIHTSGRHLLTLINDILDLSKIEAGRMEPQTSSFALSEVVQNSVALLRERATRQGISLGLEVDPSTGVIEADERMLKQVLFNLLSNALKFTGRRGHVTVTARGQGDEVTVSVRDDGLGIAPEDQARIFEEFEQVGTAQLQEGTGLGLALSRRFVELHQGRLWLESEPGQGSTFTFTLPRSQGSVGENP